MKDITEKCTSDSIFMDHIEKPEELHKMKKATQARIGIGHKGARYKTDVMLRFHAAQVAAADAVRSEVEKEVVESLGVFEVRTKCKDKYEMLTRPDWGRIFEEDTRNYIKQNCIMNPDVQIYFGDGLCAPSIKANIPNIYSTLKAGLNNRGIKTGTPFFVRYCRVNTARIIGPLLNAKVVCVLIGERPGLLTSESMSAYIAYNARPEMSESDYTVVSNISQHGILPVEAAAQIVDLIELMLKEKKSGIALKAYVK